MIVVIIVIMCQLLHRDDRKSCDSQRNGIEKWFIHMGFMSIVMIIDFEL